MQIYPFSSTLYKDKEHNPIFLHSEIIFNEISFKFWFLDILRSLHNTFLSYPNLILTFLDILRSLHNTFLSYPNLILTLILTLTGNQSVKNGVGPR